MCKTPVCRENMHIFTQNGFEFKDSGQGDLMLSGVPYSKNQTFGKADVQELAQLLMDGHGAAPDEASNPASGASQRTAVNVSDRIPRPTRWKERALLCILQTITVGWSAWQGDTILPKSRLYVLDRIYYCSEDTSIKHRCLLSDAGTAACWKYKFCLINSAPLIVEGVVIVLTTQASHSAIVSLTQFGLQI